MSLRIAFLADYPEHIPAVAHWQWDEWDRDMLDMTLDEVEALVQEGFCIENTISFSGHAWRVYSKTLHDSEA